MKTNRLMASVLIAAQMSWGTMAFAAETPAQPISPEQQMLETVIAIQGLNLKADDAQNQVASVLKQYDQSAPKDGRQQRLMQAFVDLNVYTPAQAQSFAADAQATQKRLDDTHVTSASDATNLLSSELNMVANLHPVGAQFSSCGLGTALGIGGIITAIVGLAVRFNNPTCHGNGQFYECDTTNCDVNGFCFTDYSWCEGTTCDQPGYYPDATLGNVLMITGGVAAVVGAVLAFTGSEACY